VKDEMWNANGDDSDGTTNLLTIVEIAQLLQVPRSWVYSRTRRRSADRIPGFRLGKYWRFREDEVLAWVARQRGEQHAA
jgi:excisionase family DNA binding protein